MAGTYLSETTLGPHPAPLSPVSIAGLWNIPVSVGRGVQGPLRSHCSSGQSPSPLWASGSQRATQKQQHPPPQIHMQDEGPEQTRWGRDPDVGPVAGPRAMEAQTPRGLILPLFSIKLGLPPRSRARETSAPQEPVANESCAEHTLNSHAETGRTEAWPWVPSDTRGLRGTPDRQEGVRSRP